MLRSSSDVLHVLAFQDFEEWVHLSVSREMKRAKPYYEAQWHKLIAVQSLICDEGGVFLICRVHLNLVVPRIGI